MSTVDAVCESRGFEPTLIRMDVQGLELAVLKGARRTIASGRERLRIVLEVHPQLWPLQGTDALAFDATLRQLGLRARHCTHTTSLGTCRTSTSSCTTFDLTHDAIGSPGRVNR